MTQAFPPDRPFVIGVLPAFEIAEPELRMHLRTGLVKQLLHGVFVPGAWEDTGLARVRAAAAALPSHCVLVDRSAAGLHGIDVLDYAELDVTPDLEFVSVGASNPTRRHGILGGKRDLRPEEIMVIDGVRVTTPIRTACDIACLLGRRRAIATLDAFRKVHGLTTGELTAMLPRYFKRRGVKQLRELIPLSRDGVDSQPESWLRIDIHDEGYPMPAAQVWAHVTGWGRVKIENAWEHLRIAVEYDGEEFHSEDDDRRRDDERREALRGVGWSIIVVRRDGLSGEGRDRWLDELEKVFRDRAPVPMLRRRYARSSESRPGMRRRGRR